MEGWKEEGVDGAGVEPSTGEMEVRVSAAPV